MIKTESEKKEIIDNLQVTFQKAGTLRMALRFQHDNAGMRKMEAKRRVLNRRIEALLAAAMQDWSGSAAAVVSDIKAANSGLQSSIRDIHKAVHTAQRITKALGQLDDVIDKAKKLL